MKTFELIAPCHFGLEAVLKREIDELGYDVTSVTDGRVTFAGDAEAVARINMWSRTAERVLVKLGSFKATSFEELFQGTKSLPFEEWIPKNGRFWVAKAASVKSTLFAPSAIQSVMKKAMVERMSRAYHTPRFDEDGEDYPFRVFIKNDEVTVGLDTTGESLHKRGYRIHTAKAPIAENLAAALIMLTPWKKDRILVDPFCGCGTFPIEAALMAAGMAPGMKRNFTAMKWKHVIPESIWKDAKEEALDAVDMSVETDIQGYDIDPDMVKMSRENARLAGVEKLIHFQVRDAAQLSHPKKYGFLISNPPYGERIGGDDDMDALYSMIGERYRALDSWSMYIITSYADAEKAIGRRADKNRKLYNGMLKTYFLQYMGPKPPARKRESGTGKEE